MQTTRPTIVVLDAADISRTSRFWADVLGGTLDDARDDWHTVSVGGAEYLAVQLAPDHEPPDWPGGRQQQAHLDLYPVDVEAAHDEVLGHGAMLLQQGDRDEPHGFSVYADPAGHPFCLCWE